MGRGEFFVTDRDVSYQPEPNREDRYAMFWRDNTGLYSLGSHASLKGANGWFLHRAANLNKFYKEELTNAKRI